MAKDLKYDKRGEAKITQSVTSKNISGNASLKSSSTSNGRWQVKGAASKNIAVVVKSSTTLYQAGTSIIVEKTSKPEWRMTAVEKMNMVRVGINKKDLESLKSKTNLDYDKLSALLSTNRATLINKKGKENFSTALSERIVSIAELYSYGFEVFEDEVKFNEWIVRPNKALGGKQPFELLDNQFGREEVKNVIGRIDHGVYS